MDFSEKKSRPQKTRRASNLPTPELEDPAEIYENQTTSFLDDGELQFLLREKARAKLRGLQNSGTPDKEIIVPDVSDLEAQTRLFLRKLQALSKSNDKASYLELQLLQKTFNTKSLLNIATALARMRLQEAEKERLKFWYSGDDKSFLRTEFTALQARAYRVPTDFKSGYGSGKNEMTGE